MNTTEQLQTIIRRMASNLYTRISTGNLLPDGKEKDKFIAEIDADFQKDLQELNRLCPEPSFQYHEVEDVKNISQQGAQC